MTNMDDESTYTVSNCGECPLNQAGTCRHPGRDGEDVTENTWTGTVPEWCQLLDQPLKVVAEMGGS